jgi:hypothetical protein
MMLVYHRRTTGLTPAYHHLDKVFILNLSIVVRIASLIILSISSLDDFSPTSTD